MISISPSITMFALSFFSVQLTFVEEKLLGIISHTNQGQVFTAFPETTGSTLHNCCMLPFSIKLDPNI